VLSRTYTIEVGQGTQYISWLAQTACLKFGQNHYPAGIYVPTMLSKEAIDVGGEDNPDSVPHPRKRINEIFEDGEKCVLTLKDRGKMFRNLAEEEWYEKAYGKKRNMMTYTMTLDVPEGKIPASQKYSFFAQLNYQMYPEHEKEFKHMKFENQFVV
jgi:hypothetical protein